MSDAPSPAATLDVPSADASDHADVEGTDDPERVGSDSTLREMLLATDPDRSLDDVESPYDPERGGLTRVYRGLQKALDMDGTPAIVDVVVGSIEAVRSADFEGTSEDEPDEPGSEPGPEDL